MADGLVRGPGERRSAQLLSRFAVGREHGPAFWAVLWAAAVAAEFGALVPLIFERGEPVTGPAIVLNLVGGSFAAAGLVAWRRRPDSRSGRLMTATGFAFFVSPLLTQIDAPLASTAWSLLVDVWTILFVALLLSYLSSGQLRSTVDRLLVGSFVLPLFALQVVYMLFAAEDGNLLLAFPDAGLADAVDTAQRALLAGACVATIVVLAARWRAASPPRRRALLPSVAGGLVLVLFFALLVNDIVAGSRSQALLWITACSLVTVPAAFLAGLLRSRLARSSLAELVLELRTMRGEALQAALRHALGDPGLVLARGVPEAGDGQSVAPIERNGRPVAALVYDASLDDDPELVEAVSAAAALALENEHLHAEADARLAELQASRERIVTAGDEERRRLERNLHDGAQQRLVALALQLRLIQSGIRRDPAAAEQLVTNASDELALSLDELRELARGIHPAVLDHGLEAALESLAARSSVPTRVAYAGPERIPKPVELAAYFVASEALANVAKYAGATVAEVRVSGNGRGLAISIADDGVGGASADGGSGLRGLADRVAALDGTLRVTSPPGAGTTVTAELPCAP